MTKLEKTLVGSIMYIVFVQLATRENSYSTIFFYKKKGYALCSNTEDGCFYLKDAMSGVPLLTLSYDCYDKEMMTYADIAESFANFIKKQA